MQKQRRIEREGHKFAKSTCVVCGKEYWPNGNMQKYCSDACRKENELLLRQEKKKMLIAEREGHSFSRKKCAHCGKIFWPKHFNSIYCSPKCKEERTALLSAPREAIYRERARQKFIKENEERKAKLRAENEGHLYPKKKCEYCGKEFWPTRATQKYCGKQCSYLMSRVIATGKDFREMEGHIYPKKKCAICGKEFWPKGPTTKYCSEDCAKERINQSAKERYKKNKRQDFQPRNCIVCGKEFTPTQARSIYCSEECRRKRINQKANERYKKIERQGYQPRNCIICGKEFKPTNARSKCCSKECIRKKNAFWQREFHRRIKEEKNNGNDRKSEQSA